MSIFTSFTDKWWGYGDKQILSLHALNKLRLEYIIGKTSVKGLKVLDYGCGGGLLCEPLTRLGADVDGFDVNPDCILAAKEHAKIQELNINYFGDAKYIESKSNNFYDISCCFEVLEHVINPQEVLANLARLTKPRGLVFVSTINKTLFANLTVKFAAEYILNIVPKGLHEVDMFISPEDLNSIALSQGLKNIDTKGISYNPLTKQAKLTKSTMANYISCFINAD